MSGDPLGRNLSLLCMTLYVGFDGGKHTYMTGQLRPSVNFDNKFTRHSECSNAAGG